MIKVRVETRPGQPSIVCSVESITGRGDVLIWTENEDVMDVLVDSVVTLGLHSPWSSLTWTPPIPTPAITRSGIYRAHTETPLIGLVTAAWRMPLVSVGRQLGGNSLKNFVRTTSTSVS